MIYAYGAAHKGQNALERPRGQLKMLIEETILARFVKRGRNALEKDKRSTKCGWKRLASFAKRGRMLWEGRTMRSTKCWWTRLASLAQKGRTVESEIPRVEERRVGPTHPARRVEFTHPARRVGFTHPARRMGFTHPARRVGFTHLSFAL